MRHTYINIHYHEVTNNGCDIIHLELILTPSAGYFTRNTHTYTHIYAYIYIHIYTYIHTNIYTYEYTYNTPNDLLG